MAEHIRHAGSPPRLGPAARWAAVALAVAGLLVGLLVAGAHPALPALPWIGQAAERTAAGEAGGRPSGAAAPGGLPLAGLVVTIAETGPGTSEIGLVDPTSGQTLARLAAADTPMVSLRTSRAEVLVSDAVLDKPDGTGAPPRARLRVLDARAGLATKATIPLPDRVRYTVFAPATLLSRDERYLYYLKHHDCGTNCDARGDSHAIGIIDLDARREVASTALPGICGYAQLKSLGPSDVTALCPDVAKLWKVTASGAAQLLAEFPLPTAKAGFAARRSPTGTPDRRRRRQCDDILRHLR